MKKMFFVGVSVILLAMASTSAWANLIPPQITLSSGTTGGLVFTLSGNNVNMSYAGVSTGNAILDPAGILGKYQMWMTGGPVTLTSTGNGNFTAAMNSAVIYLDVKLGTNGSLGHFLGSVTLQSAHGGSGPTPQLDGVFDCLVATGSFANLFQMGVPGTIDYTVNLGPASTLLYPSTTVRGYISSGEVVSPTPEPASLALFGTGMVGLAGLIRRKLK